MKREYTDQMERKVSIGWPPKRIISIVPSQTELLYSLGLTDEVVGITKFCVHPDEWFRTKQRVGGTKKLDFEKIAALKPDLIIGNKEENEEAQIKELMQQYSVWMSDIHNLDEAMSMISEVGELVDKESKANNLVSDIRKEFDGLKLNSKSAKALYFIWKEPYMVVGKDTFISDMLTRCGLENIATDETRYPELSKEGIKYLNPEIILLSSEPFPFSDKYIGEFRALCPDAKVILVDGEYFSWYGSRLLNAPKYFKSLFEDR